MKVIHRLWTDHSRQRHTKIFYSFTIFILLGLVPFSGMSVSDFSNLSVSDQMRSPQKGGWEQLESGTTENLHSVFFICLNRGSVVGEKGVILRTGNGGDNWTIQDSGVLENLYSIYYYDYTLILAVGDSGTILLTNNSGQNWTVIQTGMIGTYYSGQMITETIGVAVGVNAIFQPFVSRTDDAWETWESVSFYIEHESVSYEGWLSDVYFMNESVGYATAVVDMPAGGAIVRTLNGGSTWETVYFSTDELYSIDFTEAGVGYAVGNHGVILKTLNGETWEMLESGVDCMLHAIDFSSEPRGTAVGDNGTVLRTENAGASWIVQTSGTTSALYGVRFISEKIGLAIGEHGLILRTTTGGYPDDSTPPETNCALEGVFEEGVYRSNVTVSFTAIDDISGVDYTTYRLDNGLWATYEEPFVVSTDGSHILSYYSVDNAGNIEEEKTREFSIEHMPELNVTLSGGFGIKVVIRNPSSLDVKNASWTLSVEGGVVFFGRQNSGVVDIPAGDEITLRSFVLGIGKTAISFTIASSTTNIVGRVFLFFVTV